MNSVSLASMAASTLGQTAPLLAAALGGLFTATAGSLSVALEGSMLAGAFAAAAVGGPAHSLALGLAAGALSGALLSALVASAAIALRADVFVAGLAANLLAPGAASALSQAAFGTKGVLPAEAMAAGAASRAGGAWAILEQGPAFYALLAVAALLAAIHSKSVFGLRLKACGEGGEAALSAGLSPDRYRFAAHLVSGAASGLAGAAMTCGVAAFVPGMSAGRGWIALVAIYLGGRRPAGVALSCLLFGFLFAASNLAQGLYESAASGAELLQALPYLATGIAFVLWKRRSGSSSRGRRAEGGGGSGARWRG
jgi:general nucleoside transport system permease protein